MERTTNLSRHYGEIMTIITQNILDVTSGIIMHQCNASGGFGSGVAGQIAAKWPHVRASYMHAIRDGITLGEVDLIAINKDLYVANCIGQQNYGRDPNVVYTDYFAVESYLAYVRALNAGHDDRPIYIPYNMGCGLANGSWETVSKLIEQELPQAIICKLPTK